jgi:hypothetical protein
MNKEKIFQGCRLPISTETSRIEGEMGIFNPAPQWGGVEKLLEYLHRLKR